MNLWEDIDADEVEARLRALNRRLGELDEAMRGGRQMLALNAASFAAKLSLESLGQLHQRLQEERVVLVQFRKREKVTIALKGASFANHTANIGQLGAFLVRLQSLYQSVAQAITTGPRPRGPISSDIRQSADLRFADVFPSSFGMEFYVLSAYDEFGESTSVASLHTLFNLLNATRGEREIARLSGELGQRALNHLRRVLSDLHKTGAGLAIEWVDVAGTSYGWSADKSDVPVLSKNMKGLSERYVGESTIAGALLGASLLRNRFEFMDMDKNVIEGKITQAAKPKLKEFFGTWCTLRIDQVNITEKFSGETKAFYTMLDIAPRN